MTRSVDVVVVTFNSEPELLRRCIDSAVRAQRQAGVSGKVIVVDNCSVVPPQLDLPMISMIANGRNVGFGVAANIGVRASDADYVMLLNPDAEMDDEALARMLPNAPVGSNVFVVGWLLKGGGLQLDAYVDWTFSVERRIVRWRFARSIRSLGHDAELIVNKACGGALLARRELLLRYGPFDERFFLYGEDVDLSRRARMDGVRILAVPSARVAHVGAASQVGFSNIVEEARTDAAIRLAAYHRSWVTSFLQRLELFAVTLLGLLFSRTTSGSRSVRLRRLLIIGRWGVRKDLAPYEP